MLRLIGVLMGLGAIFSLLSGAFLAYQKTVMESSDLLIIGIALMVVSQLFMNMADHGARNGSNSN